MNFNDYQKEAKKTLIYKKDDKLQYLALGLTGEAGEVADKIKKIMRDKDGQINDEDKDALVKELGDVLWYMSQIAEFLGVEFEEVANKNLEKLFSRYERGVIKGEGDNR